MGYIVQCQEETGRANEDIPMPYSKPPGCNMKHYGLLLIALLPLIALAGPGDCYRIQDADKRKYCLAAAKGQKSHCHTIKDQDSRNQCLAEVGQQRSRCHSIKNKDSRAECLARTDH